MFKTLLTAFVLSLAAWPVFACTLISSLPYTISSPGRYCMAGSRVQTDTLDGITINSDNVTIDGLGHSITGPYTSATTSRGILAINRKGIIIQDIRIVGYNTSILIGETDTLVSGSTVFPDTRNSRDITINRVSADNPTFQGLHVRADNFSIINSRVSGVGPTSVHPHAFATGISGQGNSCVISDNQVTMGQATGNGENVGISLYYGAGCRIERNSIMFDRAGLFSRNFGIWARPSGGGLPYISANTVTGADYALGPFGVFANNVVNAHCAIFTRRESIVGETFVDAGNNINVQSSGALQQGGRSGCLDVVSEAEGRFFANPGAMSAYSVMLALGEVYPGYDRVEAVAWMMVAAHYNHELAVSYVAALTDPPSVISAATIRKSAILSSI